MRDPLSIATDGYLSKDNYTLAVATRGYLSTYALMVIKPPLTEGGMMVTEFPSEMKKKVLKKQENDLLLIIQIFMMRWH